MVTTPSPRLPLPASSPDPLSPALAQTLLTLYGSPLYVYNGDRLLQTIHHITRAIPYPRTQFHFASVTNGNVSLLRIFREAGWGLHANTPGDVYLGLHAGFHPSQIVYSGSNLNRAEMEQLLQWGVRTLNLDSLCQLQLFCEVYETRAGGRGDAETRRRGESEESYELRVKSLEFDSLIQNSKLKTQNSPFPRLGLRLNHPPLTGDSRIGVRPTEFAEAIALAQQYGLKISGLHFYRGTGTNATRAFTQVVDEVLAIVHQLPDLQYLDFGGGFGYPYRHGEAAFCWEEFGTELTEALNRLERPIDLVIEPGRAAIADCAVLLTQVVSMKWQGDKQIIGTDTTVANLSVPSVHGGYREIIPLIIQAQQDIPTPPHTPHPTPHTLFPTDLCGNTTYSRDYLGKNCQMPALKIGDILAILDVGAYGYAMSSHFLHRPRPAEVLLKNNTHQLIRKREDYSDLLKNQII